MVPADSDRVSPAPPYSGCILLVISLLVRDYHPLRYILPNISNSNITNLCMSYNPYTVACIGLGSSDFARHYSRNHFCFLFLRLLRCFSSPGCRTVTSTLCLQHNRLPHSDICGSTFVCNSPQLFAAYHVLRRL